MAAELVEAAPTLFLDNVNGTSLRSDILASILTERFARVRLLGETRMVPLNCAAFVAATGNGLEISEDLARRFVVCELDAKCEDPEMRPFPPAFLDKIAHDRSVLLAATLTIWRWGRRNESIIMRGRSLGSFETWCAWVRDPMLSLGCSDPVERVQFTKAKDPQRRQLMELYERWADCHSEQPIKAAQLAPPVRSIVDPQGRGGQFVASFLQKRVGVRIGGFMLTRSDAAGSWGAATYALVRTGSVDRDDPGPSEK